MKSDENYRGLTKDDLAFVGRCCFVGLTLIVLGVILAIKYGVLFLLLSSLGAFVIALVLKGAEEKADESC